MREGLTFCADVARGTTQHLVYTHLLNQKMVAGQKSHSMQAHTFHTIFSTQIMSRASLRLCLSVLKYKKKILRAPESPEQWGPLQALALAAPQLEQPCAPSRVKRGWWQKSISSFVPLSKSLGENASGHQSNKNSASKEKTWKRSYPALMALLYEGLPGLLGRVAWHAWLPAAVKPSPRSISVWFASFPTWMDRCDL